MQAFRTRDVERVLGIAPAMVRSLIRTAHVVPRRGPRGVLLFSFQDLVVIRAMRSLVAAKVPARSMRMSLRSLRSRLPSSAPLSGLSISAVGDQIAVREGSSQWDGSSGQYLMAFDITVEAGVVQIIDADLRRKSRADCDAAFEAALRLEDSAPDRALAAYRQCIAQQAAQVGAYINGGRLLHDAGRLREAAALYRSYPEPDAVLQFNLAVVLEDLGDAAGAVAAYQEALLLDEDFADAHFNLARLCEALGNHLKSLRHFNAYRRLV